MKTTDLTVTLASLAGVEPLEVWTGRDIAPLMAGEAIEGVDVLSEYGGSQQALVTADGWKYWRLADAEPRLFHLAVDPGETVDLADAEPDRAAELGARLQAAIDEAEALGAQIGTL